MRSPIIRFLASVRLGVTLLFLILLYACVFSALPQVRGAVEMTEMEAFAHWLFAVLVGAFMVALCTATWFRIRWNTMNLGVLTVHTGLLLLTGGSVWYFAGKVEGDVLLQSPRIELINTGGGRQSGIAEFLAEKGQTWGNTMPAFGGSVSLAVMETVPDGLSSVAKAVMVTQIGEAPPPKNITLSDRGELVALSDRLALRLVAFPPPRTFYDREIAALYYGQAGDPNRHRVPIEGLPMHRERYLLGGEVLRDRDSKPVPSKRTRTATVIAGIPIPTGWFEHWRMPIRLETPELPFDVTVTGFVPYIAGMQESIADGGPAENPGIQLDLAAGTSKLSQTLLALDPVKSLLATSVPFEFTWVTSETQRDAVLTPLSGPHELTVEVLDPPAKQTLSISEGQVVKVEGTPYELTIKQFAPNWPLMTPGFENAVSPMASVDVTNGVKSYNRTVIQRFPQLSQDIDEHGVRHRDAPYDPNLILRYRTAADSHVAVTAGPDLPIVVGVFAPDGTVQRLPVEIGRKQPLHIRGGHMDMTVAALHRNAQSLFVPVIEPLEKRRPNLAARSGSAVRLEMTGRGAYAGWSDTRWCLFSQYPDVDARPLNVRLPDGSQYELTYSRLEHDLGGQLGPIRLAVNFFPGGRAAETWRSDFLVKADNDERVERGAVLTNQTYRIGEWTLFQSGAATDHWSYTIVGVGNRKGIWPMLLGCVFIPLGCMYAFYVKPVLKRRKATTAVTPPQARGNGRSSNAEPKAGLELVEAR